MWHYHSVKKAKTIFSRKYILKGDISGFIKKDDIHLRKYGISSDDKKDKDEDEKDDKRITFIKSSNDFLYFYEHLYRHFHILLSSEKQKQKKPENLIYRIEI